VTLVHWDDVESYAVPDEVRPLGGIWQRLGDAAGSIGIGVHRLLLDDGQMATPPHRHTAEEEIYHVIGGSGTLWQDGSTCEVVAGDTIVYPPDSASHTLIGSKGGLDVLVYGLRVPPEHGVLTRTQVAWLGSAGVVRLTDEHPWRAEAALGLVDGTPGPRPPNVVAPGDVEGDYGGMSKRLGRAGGAVRSGLNRVALPPNEEGAPPHCHSAEEEAFVVLDGNGVLELWGPPEPGKPPASEPAESFPVRRGHVIARPPGTRRSHCLRAGEQGLTYLAYGTREPNDVCYYPRSNKIFWRGVGLIARLEPLDYFDGEPG
jgi:uncharacterized cupin superfamily protein